MGKKDRYNQWPASVSDNGDGHTRKASGESWPPCAPGDARQQQQQQQQQQQLVGQRAKGETCRREVEKESTTTMTHVAGNIGNACHDVGGEAANGKLSLSAVHRTAVLSKDTDLSTLESARPNLCLCFVRCFTVH